MKELTTGEVTKVAAKILALAEQLRDYRKAAKEDGMCSYMDGVYDGFRNCLVIAGIPIEAKRDGIYFDELKLFD